MSHRLFESEYKLEGVSVRSPVRGKIMAEAKIGLSTLHCLSQPFKEMTRIIANAKTAYLEIVDEGLHALDKRRVKILDELASSYGLEYSVHAPFADINVASPSKPILKAILKRMKKSIINASSLDCKTWVFHPGLKTGVSMFYPREDWKQNLKTIRLLHRFAKDRGVEATLENVPEPFPFLMKTVEDFQRFYAEINEDIGLAFDIGHANINEQIEDFFEQFPTKIVHIHAHDNHGENDEHLGVGFGTVDWNKVANLLRIISYDGIIIVESIEQLGESVGKLKELLA